MSPARRPRPDPGRPAPGRAAELDRDVDPAHPYRARQLAPYRRDAGLHDSGLRGRYPGLRGSGPATRGCTPAAPPGAGADREPDRASMLNARIAIVATIVVGQLWGLMVALNAWLDHRTGQVWLLLGFQLLSLAVAVAVWLAAPATADPAARKERAMTQETLPPTTSPPKQAPAAGRGMALALATIGFAVNFWAWSLLSPLAPRYQELLGLSPLAVSVMVAVPVIVGSLGRIPLAPSPTATAAASSSRPVVRGHHPGAVPGLRHRLPGPAAGRPGPRPRRGVVRGRGAVRQRLVPARAPRLRPRHLRHGQHRHRHLRVRQPPGGQLARPALGVPDRGRALAAVGLAFLVLGRDASRPAAGHRAVHDPLLAAARCPSPATWPSTPSPSAVVAFGVYLPTFLKTVYGLETTDAATRAAGFVVLATLARPSAAGWPTGSPACR